MQFIKSDLSERLLEFSAQIIRLLAALPDSFVYRRISDQLIRSAMSVGANYEEAKGADSRADFSHKLQIAFKEMRETRYWLVLVSKTIHQEPDKMRNLIDEATQLRAILGKSVATARGTAKS